MILNRPLEPAEAVYLNYWKTVCRECFGWSDTEIETWVIQNVDDFDYDTQGGCLYNQHPLERIQKLFVPVHLREKFRLGQLKGLRDFYTGLEDVLWLPWHGIDKGFAADFDWNAARQKVARLTEKFVLKNQG